MELYLKMDDFILEGLIAANVHVFMQVRHLKYIQPEQMTVKDTAVVDYLH
jgi:hypothetical protein